jgi:phage FluMu protein gp41
MVVCWSDTESVLPVEILRRAINACADAKGPSLWAIDHLGVKWNRLKHYSQSIDEAEAKSLLGRIFRASMIKVRSEMDVGTEHNDGAQPDEMDGAEE